MLEHTIDVFAAGARREEQDCKTAILASRMYTAICAE